MFTFFYRIVGVLVAQNITLSRSKATSDNTFGMLLFHEIEN